MDAEHSVVEKRIEPFLHPTRRCSSCGRRLDIHEAVKSDYCSDQSCVTASAVAAKEREKQQNRKRNLIAKRHARKLFGIQSRAARVPSMDRNLVITPPERLLRFRQTLRNAVTAAAESVNTAATDSAIAEAKVNDPSGNRVSLSCEVCRGNCCSQGSTHAFLSAEHIQSRLQENPQFTAANVYREYLRLLPVRSYEDSCVYHTTGGCAIPRHLRSDTCNRYECTSRLDYAKQLQQQNNRTLVIVAMSDETVTRTLESPLE